MVRCFLYPEKEKYNVRQSEYKDFSVSLRANDPFLEKRLTSPTLCDLA